jgi:hypothetical protein
MRAYRVNKYQVALQGEVVETGIAFIITLITINSVSCQKNEGKAKQKTEKELNKVRLKCAFRHQI